MEKKVRALISLLVVMVMANAFCLAAFGQEKDSSEVAQEFVNMGMEVFNYEHRKQAREMFEQALLYDPKNAQANLMKGKSIMMTVQKEEALPYFLIA